MVHAQRTMEGRQVEDLYLFLHGAEGEEVAQEAPSSEGEGQDPEPEGQTNDGTPENEVTGDVFSRDYVEKLRAEAASLRKERNQLREEADERRKKEMSELERAQAERDEALQRLEMAEAQAKKTVLESRIREAATQAKFHNPQDAVDFLMLDPDQIVWTDSGQPDGRSVKSAIEGLAKSRPHLVASGVQGSAEGGSRGGTTPPDDRTEQLKQEFARRGGVPIPL